MPEIDPLLMALVRKLPPPGSSWSAREKLAWMKAAEACIRVIYGDPGGEITITITEDRPS